MNDPYLYPHTDILKNFADIRDREVISCMEAEYTSIRLAELVTGESVSRFAFAALCDMHHYIFQDIYEWAGKIRIINIEKSEPALGGISIEYSDCFDIVKDATYVLDKMNHYTWEKASIDEVAKIFSEYLAELWKVHPYRDDGVIIGTRLEKPSKINGFALLSPIFLSHAGWREDGAVHINTYYTESQMGLCA